MSENLRREMIDKNQLMDRFAELDFLNELWVKAKAELPKQIADLDPFMRQVVEESDEVLARKLHKLRGLISNFLTEPSALGKLVECENLVTQGKRDELPQAWQDFQCLLYGEVERLDSWLNEQGFGC